MGKKQKNDGCGNTSPTTRRYGPDYLNYHQKPRCHPRRFSLHGSPDLKGSTPSILPLMPSKTTSPLPIPGRPSYSNPCYSHLQTRLLQLTLCRPPVNPNMETSTDSECSSPSSNKYPMEITHTTYPTTIALAPSGVPDQIQNPSPDL